MTIAKMKRNNPAPDKAKKRKANRKGGAPNGNKNAVGNSGGNGSSSTYDPSCARVSAAPDNTGEEQTFEKAKFKPGQSGNPTGRPKGSRSKVAAKFIEDFSAMWEKRGAEIL